MSFQGEAEVKQSQDKSHSGVLSSSLPVPDSHPAASGCFPPLCNLALGPTPSRSLPWSCLILVPAGPCGPWAGKQDRVLLVTMWREAPSMGEASGTQRGHLHYKLAMIKPLLTVMGSFALEVMPATADNTGDGHRSWQAGITRALPSEAV